jgi:signal transduction histidine kinase
MLAAVLILLSILSGLVMVGLGIYSRRFRPSPMALPYEFLMYGAGFWALNYAADLATTDLSLKIAIMETRFLTLPYLSLLELWLVLVYLKKESWMRRWWSWPVAGFMGTTTLLALTSTHHTLLRYNYALATFGDLVTLSFTNGIWYSLYVAVTYGIFGLILLLMLFVDRPVQSYYLFQRAIFLVALLFPVCTNISYELGYTLVPGLNVTTMLLWIPGILYIWVLFPRKFFEIIPVARDRVIEGMTNPVIILDANRRVVDMNPFASALTGIPLRKAFGIPAVKVFGAVPELVSFLSASGRESREIEIGQENKRIFLAQMDTIQSVSDTPDAYIIRLLDITERKRAETALLMANKKLNLLTSITRHDILNQLTAVQGYLDLAREETGVPAVVSGFLEKAYRASERTVQMITFTREYQQIGVQAPVWHEIGALIASASGNITPGPVKVENRIPPGFSVYADPLVEKVFYNLLDNALRYGEKITAITFSASEQGGALVILCEDDGAGIPADEKEKIFERGYGKNTGFGLFLSREILTITGIGIAEAGVPGKGARFEITVPKGGYRSGTAH